MTKPRILLSLIMSAVLLAACSASTSTVSPPHPTAVESSLIPVSTATIKPTEVVDVTPTDELDISSPTPSVEAQPIATSRGPNLEATDPTTVNMASGGLQLVEFFEFW